MGKNEAGTIIHPDWYAAIDEMTADEAGLFTKNLINRARGAKEIEVAEKRRTEKCQTALSLSGVYKLKSEAACGSPPCFTVMIHPL